MNIVLASKKPPQFPPKRAGSLIEFGSPKTLLSAQNGHGDDQSLGSNRPDHRSLTRHEAALTFAPAQELNVEKFYTSPFDRYVSTINYMFYIGILFLA